MLRDVAEYTFASSVHLDNIGVATDVDSNNLDKRAGYMCSGREFHLDGSII